MRSRLIIPVVIDLALVGWPRPPVVKNRSDGRWSVSHHAMDVWAWMVKSRTYGELQRDGFLD